MDWLRHPVAWLVSRRVPVESSAAAEAADLREWFTAALAEGRTGEAEADARTLMVSYAGAGPLGEPYLTAWRMLAAALALSGQHGEAVEELTRLTDALSSAPGVGAAVATATSRLRRAGQLAFLGRFDEAEEECRAVADLCGELPPGRSADHCRFAAVSTRLVVLNGRGLYAEAEAEARQAIEGSEPVPLCEHALPWLRRALAVSLSGQGRYAEADVLLRGLRPEGAIDVVSVGVYRAAAQLGLGDLSAAEAGARDAAGTGMRLLSPVHNLTLTAGTLLGVVLARHGRLDEARTQLQDNAAVWAERFGDAHPKTVAARAELARLDGGT
jgi:tetratricopeptide (TPR) repeat protein